MRLLQAEIGLQEVTPQVLSFWTRSMHSKERLTKN